MTSKRKSFGMITGSDDSSKLILTFSVWKDYKEESYLFNFQDNQVPNPAGCLLLPRRLFSTPRLSLPL